MCAYVSALIYGLTEQVCLGVCARQLVSDCELARKLCDSHGSYVPNTAQEPQIEDDHAPTAHRCGSHKKKPITWSVTWQMEMSIGKECTSGRPDILCASKEHFNLPDPR